MSEGPIKRERAATTTKPIPRLKRDDIVYEPDSAVGHRYRVVETDGVIALCDRLTPGPTRQVKRWVRSLALAKDQKPTTDIRDS